MCVWTWSVWLCSSYHDSLSSASIRAVHLFVRLALLYLVDQRFGKSRRLLPDWSASSLEPALLRLVAVLVYAHAMHMLPTSLLLQVLHTLVTEFQTAMHCWFCVLVLSILLHSLYPSLLVSNVPTLFVSALKFIVNAFILCRLLSWMQKCFVHQRNFQYSSKSSLCCWGHSKLHSRQSTSCELVLSSVCCIYFYS